jgi:hypothetical protein
MRLDHLTHLRKGDTIINCFQEPLVVLRVEGNNVVAVNTGLETRVYPCDHLYYTDMYEESDEEISWIKWATNNVDYIRNQPDIDIIKFVYQQGFSNGFMHQRLYRAEEQLQK